MGASKVMQIGTRLGDRSLCCGICEPEINVDICTSTYAHVEIKRAPDRDHATAACTCAVSKYS